MYGFPYGTINQGRLDPQVRELLKDLSETQNLGLDQNPYSTSSQRGSTKFRLQEWWVTLAPAMSTAILQSFKKKL